MILRILQSSTACKTAVVPDRIPWIDSRTLVRAVSNRGERANEVAPVKRSDEEVSTFV